MSPVFVFLFVSFLAVGTLSLFLGVFLYVWTGFFGFCSAPRLLISAARFGAVFCCCCWCLWAFVKVEGQCTGSALSNCMQGVPRSQDSNQFCWPAEEAMACANELMDNCKDTTDESFLEALATLNIEEIGQQFTNNCFT